MPSSDSARPFFSILIPSYNRPEFIGKCLASIMSSGCQDFEVVVSDDNSPRASEVERAVKPFLNQERVRFFRQSKNLREPGNKNFLVGQARGRYTMVLGDDDQLYPNSLAKLKAHIAQAPGYDLYAFGFTVIDEEDRTLYSRRAPRQLEVDSNKTQLVEQLFFSDIFPFWLYHSNTFCCRNGVEAEMPYGRDAGIGEDFLFFFDLVNKGRRFLVLPESLFMWRKFQSSNAKQTNQSQSAFSNVVARKNILRHLQRRTDLLPEIRAFLDNPYFRRRFLFEPLLRDAGATAEAVDSLQLTSSEAAELAGLRRRLNRFDIHLMPYLRRCADFIRLFGLAGAADIFRVVLQRASYLLRSRRERSFGAAGS